jgi:2-phospho-L-lactate guanylyltransferase
VPAADPEAEGVSTVAILPVKRLPQAKQRLGPGLGAEPRRALAAAMARDVLDALAGVGGLDGVIVVTGEPEVAEAARGLGAEVLGDERDAGQSPAALIGIARARERGARHALLVPGDCPALDPAEVERLLAGLAPAPSVAVVPDRHGTGTNALVLAPPDVIAPAFGPGSFDRHVAAGREAGAAVHVERLASLQLDVDTAGDLEALREALAGRPGAAPRTREVLEGLEAGAA